MAIALRLGRSGQPVGYRSVLSFLFVLFSLVMVVKTAIDTYQEHKHAEWPSVVATISQETVRTLTRVAEPSGRSCPGAGGLHATRPARRCLFGTILSIPTRSYPTQGTCQSPVLKYRMI